jgi:hypothetical protein
MLNSHKYWQSVEGTAEIRWYRDDKLFEQYNIDFYIDQPTIAHIIETSTNGFGIPLEVIIENETRYAIPEGQKVFFESTFGQNDLEASINALPENIHNEGEIFLDWPPPIAQIHAFGSLFLSPIGNYIYPQWVAVDFYQAEYVFVEDSRILGRPAWVIEYHSFNGFDNFMIWAEKIRV